MLLPAVARYGQCASGVTCQLVQVPTPFFLAAQRRTASAVKKKLPKGNPWKGFPLDSFPNRGARPLWHPELPGTDSVTNRACSRTFEYWVVGSTTNLQDPTQRKANFHWKFLCAGAAFSAMRSPVPHCSPPRKDFCRAKMPCGGRVPPNLLLGKEIVGHLTNQ